MYIPHRKIPQLRLYATFVVCALGLLWISVGLWKRNKVPFPRVPDVPAHIPFRKSASWNPDGNSTAFSRHGMVASDSDYCSELGARILRAGGNAADSAVTTCLCIGSTDTMFSSGIGGGAFITSKRKEESEAISIDAREMAPGAAHANMFRGREYKSQYGGLASGIPGELKGLWSLYKLHGSGKLEWSELVTPVAELLDSGWKIDKRLAFALKTQYSAFQYFRKDWDFVFKAHSNELLQEGDLMRRPALAKTLYHVAENGAEAFYDPKGYIARSLAAKNQEWEGLITPEDFAKYDVVVEKALTLANFTNDNLTVFSANGASSGLALISGLSVLNAMEDFGESDHSPTETHRMVEIMKWMASVRSYLGDGGIYNTNKTQLAERSQRYAKFLSPDYIADVIAKIDDNTTYPWEYYKPAYEPNDPHGTSSLSVVDKFGNAVVLTTTVNLLFGSCVHDPVTGVILNNEMDDFSLPHTKNAFGLEPSIFNYIAPYKRPLSSSAQSIVVDSDGNIELAIGAAGGSRITTAIFQGIVRVFFDGKNITNIIANPRMHHQLLPNKVYLEHPTDEELVLALKDRGHHVETIIPVTAMNAIRVSPEGMWGQSDWWRKFGVAVGV